MKHVFNGILVCLLAGYFISCEVEPDTFIATGDSSYFAPSGTSLIQYQVDSVIYDPVVGGTAQIESSSIWTLTLAEDTARSKTFFVSVLSTDSGSIARQRYIWDFETSEISGMRHVNQLDGFSYVSLVTPFTKNSTWEALHFADPNVEISVAGEPLLIHKDWTSARIDSIGSYTLPDGSSVDAVYVILTASENAIELREYREVYGKGLGLLERTQRFLDTQQSSSVDPWEDKAENGFTVEMKRLF